MKPALSKLLVGLLLIAPSSQALAEASGNASDGLMVAQRVCAQCHAVVQGARASPNPQAPTFGNVANAAGMTDMALRVWFRSPHPSMPNLKLTGQESDDAVAYILSLRKRQ